MLRSSSVWPTKTMTRAYQVPFVLLSLLAALMVPLAGQPRERFLLGVMRRDGVILPFAAFDGRWSMPWPSSLRNVELPATLADVPADWWGGERPQDWMFHPLHGQSARVRASALVTVVVGREKRLGIGTDFVSAEPPAPLFELPYPKDGLALAGRGSIEPIPQISRFTPAWKNLPALLRDDMDEAERLAIARVRSATRWTHPVGELERRRVIAELEAWYSAPLVQPGFSASYVEAVKKYPPGPEDDGCGLETFISGWVHADARRPTQRTDLTAQITYCDRSRVSYMLPLGRVLANHRTHWVFQLSSWEREWYAVVEVTPGRTRFVVEFFGGARPDGF